MRYKRFSILRQDFVSEGGGTLYGVGLGETPWRRRIFENLQKCISANFSQIFKSMPYVFERFDEKSKNPRLLSLINYLFKISFLFSYQFRFINVPFLSELFLTAANFSALRKSYLPDRNDISIRLTFIESNQFWSLTDSLSVKSRT